MPAFVVQRKLAAHRGAAKALLRALLTQCSRLPFEPTQKDQIRNVIRNRFRHARCIDGLQRLRFAFDAGYEAIDLLDAAVANDAGSKSYILDLLEQAPPRIKEHDLRLQKIREVQQRQAEGEERKIVAAERRQKSILDRPISKELLTGKRHVPVLFSASLIPVLRIKKPQPLVLSQYINRRVKQRQKRHDLRHVLDDQMALASQEDAWDHLVARHHGIGSDAAREMRWTNEIYQASGEVQALLDDERDRARVMAEKMQDVVDKERQLYQQERAERKLEKVGLNRAEDPATENTQGDSET